MAKRDETFEDEYTVTACVGSDLSPTQLTTCMSIIKEGSAVNTTSAKKQLPLAPVVVIVHRGEQIVGIGAIKQPRPDYASSVANKSGHSFDKTMSELGYVAVDKQ